MKAPTPRSAGGGRPLPRLQARRPHPPAVPSSSLPAAAAGAVPARGPLPAGPAFPRLFRAQGSLPGLPLSRCSGPEARPPGLLSAAVRVEAPARPGSAALPARAPPPAVPPGALRPRPPRALGPALRGRGGRGRGAEQPLPTPPPPLTLQGLEDRLRHLGAAAAVAAATGAQAGPREHCGSRGGGGEVGAARGRPGAAAEPPVLEPGHGPRQRQPPRRPGSASRIQSPEHVDPHPRLI